MRNEPTLTEKTKRLDYLKKMLVEIENHEHAGNSVKNWLAWRTLPVSEKERIHAEWQGYYPKAWQTKAAKRFLIMKEIFKRNMHDPALQEWAVKAREQIKNNDWELKEPIETDGYELQQNFYVQWYMHVEHKIKEINPDPDETGLNTVWK